MKAAVQQESRTKEQTEQSPDAEAATRNKRHSDLVAKNHSIGIRPVPKLDRRLARIRAGCFQTRNCSEKCVAGGAIPSRTLLRVPFFRRSAHRFGGQGGETMQGGCGDDQAALR